MVKILSFSDCHGLLPTITTSFDLLLIPGDICFDGAYAEQEKWINEVFVPWVNGLPYRNPYSKVVMTWGNHDFFGERCSKATVLDICLKTHGRLIILKNKEFEFSFLSDDDIKTLSIFGTPYCSQFGTWAFMVSNSTLEKKYSQIPEGIDILLSHDSPNINGLGAIREGQYKNETTGNAVLGKELERIKPKLFLSGHFHSGNHGFERLPFGTMASNVSLVNEDYAPINGVLEINYDEKTGMFEKV